MATIESLVEEQQENDKQLNKDAEEYKKNWKIISLKAMDLNY